MLKYLRIAVTALSLTACVLLIALWVRGQFWVDWVHIPLTGGHIVTVASWPGCLIIRIMDVDAALPQLWFSYPVSEHGRQVWRALYWSADGSFLMPCWLAVLITVTLAAFPWLPLRRFSLRTLLIATTLVAVALGIIISTS